MSYAHGRFLPWTSFAFTFYLDSVNLALKTVLEFGAGTSTLYFANRCKFVTSVEFDHIWAQKIQASVNALGLEVNVIDSSYWHHNDNQALTVPKIVCEAYKVDVDKFSEYLPCSLDFFYNLVVDEARKADFIFIDGGFRNTEIVTVGNMRKETIIIDNADQASLAYGLNFLKEIGYKEIPFHGLGPLNPYGFTTSIFYLAEKSIF